MSHQTVINYLKKIGFTKKLDVWVPHIFARIDACESLLNRNKIDPFLKRMVTGDEKWVTYYEGIMKLASRWALVIEQNGAYLH